MEVRSDFQFEIEAISMSDAPRIGGRRWATGSGRDRGRAKIVGDPIWERGTDEEFSAKTLNLGIGLNLQLESEMEVIIQKEWY